MLRATTFYITTAGNASVQDVDYSTQDDFQTRTVKKLISATGYAGFSVFLKKMGKPQAQVDSVALAAQTRGVEVDVAFPPQIRLTISTQDLGGTARTNYPITLVYEVAQE